MGVMPVLLALCLSPAWHEFMARKREFQPGFFAGLSKCGTMVIPAKDGKPGLTSGFPVDRFDPTFKERSKGSLDMLLSQSSGLMFVHLFGKNLCKYLYPEPYRYT